MANDEEVQTLIIARINPHHFPHIIKALEKGKHVLVGKPVVTNYNYLDQIGKKVRDNDLLIFPSHNIVYRPVVT